MAKTNKFSIEDDILYVRMLIGDTETSPFYPLFTDEEYEMLIERYKGDLKAVAISLAISASFKLAGWNTRERTGSIEVWNNLGANYLKALQYFIDNQGKELPKGILPWLAGENTQDMCRVKSKPYFPNTITSIKTCDSDDICNTNSSCGCKGVCGC